MRDVVIERDEPVGDLDVVDRECGLGFAFRGGVGLGRGRGEPIEDVREIEALRAKTLDGDVRGRHMQPVDDG